MSDKQYMDANQLNHDSFLLAKNIYDSGFIPDAIIVLWRGGSLIGMIIQELFTFKGIKPYHTIIKASAYQEINKIGTVEVENMDHVLQKLKPGSQILLVDDIFDTGKTMEAVKNIIAPVSTNIKIATLFYKPTHSLVNFTPDFYLKTIDKWLVFPHEIVDLTPAEIKEKDPVLARLLEK